MVRLTLAIATVAVATSATGWEASATSMSLRHTRRAPEDKHQAMVKVTKLLQDVRASVSRDASAEHEADNSLTKTLGEFEESVHKELSGMGKRQTQLIKLQATRAKSSLEGVKELKDLDSLVSGSQSIAASYEKGTEASRAKYERVVASLAQLRTAVDGAVVTTSGQLVTPAGNGAEVLLAVRRVLSHHSKELKHTKAFASVLQALSSGSGALTPQLLLEASRALTTVQASLEKKKQSALLQYEARSDKYASDARQTAADEWKQEALHSQQSTQAAELGTALDFAKAVARLDAPLVEVFRKHAAEQTVLQEKIHKLRSEQDHTLGSLLTILTQPQPVEASLLQLSSSQGQHLQQATAQAAQAAVDFSNDNAAAQAEHLSWLWSKHSVVSFAQVSEDVIASAAPQSLTVEIEKALREHGDTHAILMRVSSQLQRAQDTSLDSSNVQEVITSFQSVLRKLQSQQDQAAKVKAECESETFRAKDGEQMAKASLVVTATARRDLIRSVADTQKSVKGLSKKEATLMSWAQKVASAAKDEETVMADQHTQRKTVLVALQKASEVLTKLPSQQSMSVVLAQQASKHVAAMDGLETAKTRGTTALVQKVGSYMQNYKKLLHERKEQLDDSVAEWQLHLAETQQDDDGQSAELSLAQTLDAQGTQLCSSMLKSYQAREAARKKSIAAIKQVLPQLPQLLLA